MKLLLLARMSLALIFLFPAISFAWASHSTRYVDGFEYGHWVFPLDQQNQQIWLNNLGQQGWIECFPHKSEIYCSRTTPWSEEWSARVEWKSWEVGKWTNIDTLLGEAGKVDYDQCFVWNAKRLWCSRPPNN